MQNTRSYSALVAFLLCTTTVIAQPVITLAGRISSGLSSPIQLVNAGDGSGRIFIVEKGGAIKVFDSGYNLLSTFLQVAGVNNNNEQGLLSVAFHPDYSTNGFLYVYYVNMDDDLVLDRYTVSADPNVADENSGVNLITIPHRDNENHNGGELHFGSDGYLYLSTGDGGGTGDVLNNAQNTSVLLGKILRFNVTANAPYYTIPPGNPFGNEVYDLGLRNPFRWSFDRQTGDMWIGDVGQDSYEEVNFRPAAATPGANYGWRCYEADNAYNTAGCGPANSYLEPAFFYPTQDPAAAITGGVVYRGNNYPSLNGYYICADYFSGTFYLLPPSGPTVSTQSLTPAGIVDFGEDEAGEVYAVSITGNSVYQVTATGAPLPVTLTSFTGKVYNGSSAKLDWTTAMESNVSVFEVGRSRDGSSFSPIATKMAVNEPNGAAYSITDEGLHAGNYFYRLKIIDMDGSYSFSPAIRIAIENSRVNWVYPSIVTEGYVLVTPPEEGYQTVEVYNANGLPVLRRNIRGVTGNIKLNTSHQPAGLYIVRLLGNNGVLTSRIVIQ